MFWHLAVVHPHTVCKINFFVLSWGLSKMPTGQAADGN
jgi:hypothetical protein